MDCRNSMAMQDKAKALIPGKTQLLSKRPEMFAPGVWPGYYKKAKGDEIWDLDDNRYVDCSIGGIGANVLGYADPDVDQAVSETIANGSSSSLCAPEEVELAELLTEIHPWAKMARFARTGGEAMAIAVRIARAATGKDVVAFCGYHGWQDWYLAANLSGTGELSDHLLPGLDPAGVPAGLKGTALPFRYNQIDELKKLISQNKDRIGAIVMEPMRDNEPQDNFLQNVRDIADEVGAILVFDEITAAFRLNLGGLHLRLGVNPDIAVFSKALSNGYPMAAIIGTEPVMQAAQNTFISSTAWTERIGPTAALATIKKFRDNQVHEHIGEIGDSVVSAWKEAASATGLSINYAGFRPLMHFSFDNEQDLAMRTLFTQEMLDRGYLASGRFYAMYAHTQEHVEGYRKACKESFEVIANKLERNELNSSLRGAVAHSGFSRLT